MTATFDTVTGQQPAGAILRAAVAEDRLGHALLLVGPEGVGQADLVAALAAALNCPDTRGGVGCGDCAVCGRIARRTHAAVVTFRPEGAFHLVDAVRDDWIPTASRTLVEGRRRVCRIVEADRMNETTQNAFLKVLEEPPPSTMWVLEASSTAPLLDTILSRCRRIDVSAWGRADLDSQAQGLGLPDDLRAALVRAAQGSPARLEEYTQVECPWCGTVRGGPGVAAANVPAADVPTHCENTKCKPPEKDMVGPAELVRDLARGRHLGVVQRLRTDGPGAVGAITVEVMAWADARADAEAPRQQQELEALDESFGPRGWPSGMKARLKARHKREQRQARLAAVSRFLEEFGSALRDVVALRAGADPIDVVNLDAPAMVEDAAALSTEAALRALAMIPVVQEAVVVNSAQPQLQLERLLLPLAVAIFAARS